MNEFKELESPSGAWIRVDGRPVLSFGGCCYLGLSKIPELIDAGTRALKDYGTTAQMSRYYGFSRKPNRQAEAAARKFFQAEAAMYFSTGYLFGAIALTSLVDRYDVIFLDETAHYSLSDGATLSGKPVFRFQHKSAEDLERVIAKNLSPGEKPLVATDGMFPTFGDVPPLDEYWQILKKYDGWLVVDESHAFGTVGESGRGAVEYFGLNRERVIAGGSLGKAFGAFGGIAVGTEEIVAQMRSAAAARGSAAGTASNAAMAAASFAYIKSHPERLQKLRTNAKRLKQGLARLGLTVEQTEFPVATFTVGDAASMKKIQQQLWQRGIFVGYTTYVGAGTEGAIRCAVFSDHEPEDIDRLLDELENVKE